MNQLTIYEIGELLYTTHATNKKLRMVPKSLYEYNEELYQQMKQDWKWYNKFPVVRLFEEMIEEKGTYPTEAEYIAEALRIATPIFKEVAHTKGYTVITPQILEFFTLVYSERMAQTYASKMCEEFTIAQMKLLFPTAYFYTDRYIDTVMGVDIAMELEGDMYYIHIQSKSNYNEKKLKDKGSKTKFPVQEMRNDKLHTTWVKYERDFDNHIIFEYTWEKSDNTNLHGGVPTFTHRYIMDKIALRQSGMFGGKPLEKASDPISITRLHDSLVSYDVIAPTHVFERTEGFRTQETAHRGKDSFRAVYEAIKQQEKAAKSA